MAKALSAKQRAALRKAQLASARKRKGKRKNWSDGTKGGLAGIRRAGNAQYGKVKGPRTRYRKGINKRNASLAAAGVGLAVIGAAVAKDYHNHKKRVKNTAHPTKSSHPARHLQSTNSALRQGKAVASANRRASVHRDVTNASAHHRANAARRANREQARQHKAAARQTRINQKLSDRGMYNSGLNSNVGGRTFVATRHGVSHRR